MRINIIGIVELQFPIFSPSFLSLDVQSYYYSSYKDNINNIEFHIL